jgi:hypothetical protein
LERRSALIGAVLLALFPHPALAQGEEQKPWSSLTDEEKGALIKPDIGLLYVLGVNGQLLMHFAALHKIEWPDYLERMRQGLKDHGQVREGVYAATGYEGVEAHDARLKNEREKR